MANEQNLKPVRTKEEARERGKKGGKKSGEVRKRRKAFKEALLLALDTVKDNKTIQDIGIEALMVRYMAGDLEAFKVVRDTIGEKPTDSLKLGADEDKPFEVNINVVK